MHLTVISLWVYSSRGPGDLKPWDTMRESRATVEAKGSSCQPQTIYGISYRTAHHAAAQLDMCLKAQVWGIEGMASCRRALEDHHVASFSRANEVRLTRNLVLYDFTMGKFATGYRPN